MEEEEKNLLYEKNIYKYRTLYLIRINLPSSEYIYIIIFLIKYIGLILFSISLNENLIERQETSFKTGEKFNSSIINFQSFLSKFMITGSDLKILKYNYTSFCLLIFIFLLLYILCVIFGLFYMKTKYYNKNYVTPIEQKIKNISSNSKFEKILFKIIAYIFIFISFFHQIIIEYLFFGFIGNAIYIFGVFNGGNFNASVSSQYSIYVMEYFRKEEFSKIFIVIINLISIVIILLIFILFMILNSSKSLFINIGFPIYGVKKFIILKIIFCSYSCFYGFVKMLDSYIKKQLFFFIVIVTLILIIIDIILSFYNFSFYPNRFCYTIIFIEFFCLFGNFIELIIYLTNSHVNSLKFKLIKLFIELINTILFTSFIFSKKRQNNFEMFAKNLFNKDLRVFNPNDIYYYIETYINYSKNNNSNYMKIFRIIQTHILSCNNRECPGKKLIPKSITYSIFTNFSNNIEQNLDNINNISKISETKITKISCNNNKRNSRLKKGRSKKNISSLIEEKEKRKSNFGKEGSEKIIEKNSSQKSLINLNKKKTFGQNISTIKSKTTIDKEEDIYKEERKLKDEQFQMIGEQEIINRINRLYNLKNYCLLEIYIFIHLQYLIRVKQNYRLALYYNSKYSLLGKEISFLSRYYLYEIKKFITKSIIGSKNIKLKNIPYIIKYQKENHSLKKLIDYLKFFSIIKKLLKTSCEEIIYFYSFCSELHNSLSLQKYAKSKIYPIIKAAEKIKDSIFKLKFLMEKYNMTEKHPIESIELSYLLTNFFKLIDGKLEQNITKNITPILYFKKIHYEKLENEYHSYLINNPLIISLEKDDSFKITYFTNIFMEKLGYSNEDLKFKDFHEKLFPGGPELVKEHTFIMKQFLFFYKNTFSKYKTFIKSKENYLVSVDIVCKLFPNFSEDFSLIANITFNDDNCQIDFENPTNINNKLSNAFNNISSDKTINTYSFLLNYDFDIFGMTKNFFLEYDLNQYMIRELRLNFCQFFCMDENKLIDQIHKEKNKLSKLYPNIDSSISLTEINKAYSAFQNISIENIFKIRKENILENYFIPPIIIYDKIDKKRLLLKIPEIINIIDEIGLDYDWFIRLKKFREIIINNLQSKDSERSIKTPNTIENNNRYSSAFDTIKLDFNLIKNEAKYFDVAFSVRKIGSLTYYIAILSETIDNSICKNSSIKENFSNNEKFRKKGIKTTIKLNRFLSTLSIKDDDNKNEGDNFKQRKAKTKALLSPKKNSLSLTQPDIHNNNININIDKEKKKEENEMESENMSDELKTKKYKKLDKIEYVKKIKTKKKENEEEENSPLIEKDKFNMILQKNKKRNNILIIIIFIIIIFSLILNFAKFTISIIGFEISKNVLKTMIYFEMLKIDIYVQGILSIIYCINENENITDLSYIHNEAKLKIQSTINHINLLQEQLNIIINNQFCSSIFKILEEKVEISSLNDDWSISNFSLELTEEIRTLSYKLSDLSNSVDTCNITSTFYHNYKFSSDIFFSGKVGRANEIQKIFYYFLSNIFTTFKVKFDILSEECSNIIENLWFHYKKILYGFISGIVIINIIFIIFYIIKICFDYSYYQLLILYYYNIENEQMKFQNQIFYLNKLINEFNSNNIDYFEYVKSNPHLIFYNKINNNDNNNIIHNNTNNSITEQKKNVKIRNSLKAKDIVNNINKIKDRNSVDGSILNDKSSAMILNNSNNKLPLGENNNIYMDKLNESEEKKNSKEESIDSLLKISNRILPISLRISLIIILLVMCVYLVLCAINILVLISDDKIWRYSVNLSMNILERIPRLMGLLIYASYSIINNKEDLMKGNPYDDNQSIYLKYFEATSPYYSEEIMKKYFKNKYFGLLLRDSLRINYNLENYLFQENDNIFSLTKEWELLLRESGYFCINAAKGEVLSFQKEYTPYEFADLINSYASICFQDKTGINEAGIQLEITFILQEIVIKYIEFITYNISNISLEEARKNFFGSSSFRRIIVDMQLSLVLYYNTITYALDIDFEKKNSAIINQQIMFSNLLIIANLVIITTIFFSLKKKKKYKDLFGFFSKIPNNNINNN